MGGAGWCSPGPCCLTAHRHPAKPVEATAFRVKSADSVWEHLSPDPAEALEVTSIPVLKLEPVVFLPTTGGVSWMSSSSLEGAWSKAGAGSE